MAKILLEHGLKKWDDTKLVAQYVLDEIVDESLIDNPDVLKLLNVYKNAIQSGQKIASKNFFIYHTDSNLSAFAVSLLNFPYEESEHWRREFNQASGYRKELFEKDYVEFISTISRDNQEKLSGYLNTERDNSLEEVESTINYLKLRKIKRLLLQNQLDMEKPQTTEEYEILHHTHEHLKNMEIDLSKKSGAVILR